MKEYDRLLDCVRSIRKKTDFVPQIALVLGSGLGFFADQADVTAVIDYRDISGFPVSTVPGHSGRLAFGYLDGVPVCIFQGRVHLYEGYTAQDVAVPARVARMLGAEILLLTNSAGGLADGMCPGDLMLISDHISTFVPSPLRGENLEELGPRFPDMSGAYDAQLRGIALRCAESLGIPLSQGIYAQTPGPQYETPAEVQMLKMLGADAVGMSTACEASAACHAGLRVCGISCISNLAAGISQAALTHQEVQRTAQQAAPRFGALLRTMVKEFAVSND